MGTGGRLRRLVGQLQGGLFFSWMAEGPEFVRLGGQAVPSSANGTRTSVAIGFGSPSGDTGVTRLDEIPTASA